MFYNSLPIKAIQLVRGLAYALNVQKLFIAAVLVLVCSGCSGAAPSSMSWSSLYQLNSEAPTAKRVPIEDFSSADNHNEFKRLIALDLQGVADYLGMVSEDLLKGKDSLGGADVENLVEGERFISGLREDILREIQNIDQVLVDGCPETYSDQKAQQIKKCGEISLAWGDLEAVALKCSIVKASKFFSRISSFEVANVEILSRMSNDARNACTIFPSSHRYGGHPKSVGITWIPEKFQSDVEPDKNNIVVEVAEGLWASNVGDQTTLETAIYASWHGYCAPYRNYERLLSDAGLLLGSIKSGDCRN